MSNRQAQTRHLDLTDGSLTLDTGRIASACVQWTHLLASASREAGHN